MADKPTTLDTLEEKNSKVSLNRFQFLLDNPLLLQDLLSREKLIPPDQLEIDWTLHPDRPVAQAVSLNRLQRSYLASRFRIRIISDSRVLAMPSNPVSPYNSSNSVDLKDVTDLDAIPPVVNEFLTLPEDRYMLLLHCSESSWEMIGCLSPMAFIKPEVVDLSSDEEEVGSHPLHFQSTSSTIRPELTNGRNLQHVNDMKVSISPHFDGHQATPVTKKISLYDSLMSKMRASVEVGKQPSLFQCSICKQKLSSKSSLSIHMNRTHDPKKERKCPDSDCSYVAYRKSTMTAHIQRYHPTMTEVAIYNCPTCAKKFSSVNVYWGHVKICSGICSLPCSSCDYVTKRPSCLANHQRRMHPNYQSRELLPDIYMKSRSITAPL